ncbi:MAG: neuraminidase-like domain-containing protein [Gemmatimonadota bacterium]
MTFQYTGRIIDRQTRRGVAGVQVQAWDRDTRHHDHLGEVRTDVEGRFQLRFTDDSFGDDAPNTLPDLFFRVYHHGALVADTGSAPLRDLAPAGPEIVVEVDAPPGTVFVGAGTQVVGYEADDTRAALGPGAYLADLMDFLRDAFPAAFPTDAAVSERFHRPLAELRVDRAAAEVQVLQADAAREVLERYLLSTRSGLTREALYADFARGGAGYPHPGVLGRALDLALAALGTTRAELGGAWRAAHPAQGEPDPAPLAALLERMGLPDADLPAALHVAPADLAALEALQPGIATVDALPDVLLAAATHGINPADPMQLPALDDARTAAAAAVDRIRQQTLAEVRADLVHAAIGDAAPDAAIRTARDLGNWLHTDLSVDATVRTTRLADAIQALQSFVLGWQLGRESAPLALPEPDFEARWRWLQSYSLWHAAQSVYFHPENFTLPDVRPGESEFFRELRDDLAGATTPEGVRGAVGAYREKLERMATDRTSPPRVYHTASLGDRAWLFFQSLAGEVFMAEQGYDGSWNGWSRVHDVPTQPLIATVAFNERIYLFFRHAGNARVLRYTWMEPGGKPHKELLESPELRVDLSSYMGDYAFVPGAKHLTLYYRYYYFSDRFHGACMDHLHRWHLSLPATPIEPNNSALPLEAVGHLDGVDYLLGGTVMGFRMFAVPDPYGPEMISGGELQFPNERGQWRDLRVFDKPRSAWDYAGAVLDGRLLVMGHCEPEGPVWAHFAPDVAPAWAAGPAGLRVGHIDPLRDRLLVHGAQPAPFQLQFRLLTRSMQEIDRGRTFVDVSEFLRHPLGEGLPALRAYAAAQEQLIGGLRHQDFAHLYAAEWYLLAPLAAAQALADLRSYPEALEYLHVLFYPYAGPSDRLVYAGFRRPDDGAADTRDSVVWLRDPFNPHAIARVRPSAYRRHTVARYAEVLLDWADAEFVQDTAESLARARELYELADDILRTSDLPMDAREEAWRELAARMYTGHDAVQVRILQLLLDPVRRGDRRAAAADVRHLAALVAQAAPFPARAAQVMAFVASLPSGASSLGEALEAAAGARADAAARLLAAGDGDAGPLPGPALQELRLVEAADARVASGFAVPDNPVLASLRWRIDAGLEKLRTGRNYVGMRRSVPAYPAGADPLGLVQQSASGEPGDDAVPSEPPPVYRFSYLVERARYFVSTAQQLEALLLASLEKSDAAQYDLIKARQDLRAAQANVALQGLRVREAGDNVTLAQLQKGRSQFQAAHFQALLQTPVSWYEQAAIDELWHAHDLSYAAALVGGGSAVAGMIAGAVVGSVGGPAGTGVGGVVGGILGALTGGLGAISGALSAGASAHGSKSQIYAMRASYERRAEEWRFQQGLAVRDVAIGEQGIRLATDHLAIVQQEQGIAQLQGDFAGEVVNFLSTKFTNKQLYDWMARVVRRYYRDHLNFATVTARMAQTALAFERREAVTYVAAYYAEREKKDLLVAERLLTDINRLDQHRLTTERRRKELVKTISLASYAPVEFQRLRSEGWMTFTTLMDWFDRDFPGHYMRLVKSVGVTVVGLIPPGEGIRATLSNPGISRVMVGPPFDQPTEIQRQPESVSVTAPNHGTGLFELRFDDPVLLPFEGSGVETTWTLEMPRAANRFDYGTLADVLLTVSYTALDDSTYRDRVVQRLGSAVEGINAFSIRTAFADAWYHLHNPVFAPAGGGGGCGPAEGAELPPYTMELEVRERDFAPNEEIQGMKRINLALRQEHYVKVPVEVEFSPAGDPACYRVRADAAWDPEDPASAPLSLAAFTHRREGDGEWTAVSTQLSTLRPAGRWRIRLRNEVDPAQYPGLFSDLPPVEGQRRLELGWLEDALFVLTYSATVEYKFAS